MDMENQSIAKTQVDSKADQLKAIIFLLQTNLEEFKSEVDSAYALLKIGEKTDLSQRIECMMDDPLSNIFNLSCTVDDQAKIFIDRLVKSFLRHNSGLIISAYRTSTYFKDLHYTIVLKSDNRESRDAIFKFHEKYDILDISHKFPVYFQFTPIELIHKIPVEEEIIPASN